MGTDQLLTLGDPVWLATLAGVVVLAVLVVWSGAIARARLRRFASTERLAELAASVSSGRRVAKVSLSLAGAGLLSIALAQPQTDPEEIEVRSEGRDIVFVVDVSRSMLAQDLAPNRLERTKLWIGDLVGSLEGDRVGLVAFAGAAVVKCPLTLDRRFFSLALQELGPNTVPVGGTFLGDAVRKTMSDVFMINPDDETDIGPVRDIILITDGDDHESFPIEAAAAAGEAGIRILTIGVGTGGDGALVPSSDDGESVMTYRGQPVRSALDSATLAEMARVSAGGVYLNVGTGEIDLDEVDRDLRAADARIETRRATTTRWTARFYIPLGFAVLFLLVEPLIGERRKGGVR